jgi:hypothetical protein
MSHKSKFVCTVQIRQDRRQVFFRVTRVLHQILRPGLRKQTTMGVCARGGDDEDDDGGQKRRESEIMYE